MDRDAVWAADLRGSMMDPRKYANKSMEPCIDTGDRSIYGGNLGEYVNDPCSMDMWIVAAIAIYRLTV